jgi:hypothetical protein
MPENRSISLNALMRLTRVTGRNERTRRTAIRAGSKIHCNGRCDYLDTISSPCPQAFRSEGGAA